MLVNDLDATHSFSFLLTSGNLDDAFTIDPDTGAITVRTTEALNHEARPSYELTVEVVDSVEPSRQASAVVTIGITDANEFAPAFNDQAITIDENLSLDAVVGTLTATDQDSSQSLQFSITGGNTNAAFKIDSDTGELRVNNPVELDFEVSPTFTLNVQVSDTGAPADSDSAIVTIHLNDVNEFSPVIAPQIFTLEELPTFSTAVGTVVATDLDASQTLRFAIIDGNLGNAFSIDAVTGGLRVIQPTMLDFETTPTFLLAISATDSGQPTRTGTGTVTVNLTDLNEFPPTVEPGSFSVQENSAVGAVVGVVTASDMDAEQALTFAITGGNTGNAFTVDSVTGEIRVHENSLLDLEGGSAWTLTVTATDTGQPVLTSNGTVTISLTDVNEFDPAVGEASFPLAENPVAGAVIGSLNADDADSSQLLTFTVVAGTPENAVTIDASNGEIRVRDPAVFDLEVRPTITLTVLVSDSGEPARTDTANVTIHLQDVNETAPQLEQTTFHVDENITGGPTVTDLVVNDADLLQTHTFEILSGNTDDVFWIDAATGVIKLWPEASLDHEAISTFLLAVQVTDNGVPPRSATETVTIVVDNVNEIPSANAGGPYPMDAGTALLLDASNSTDPDTDDLLRFKWDFNLDGTFDVTTNEAMLTVEWSTLANVGLRPGTHEIQLEIVDGAGRSSLASANVVISDTFIITPTDSDQKDLTLSLTGELVEVYSSTNLLNAVLFSDIDNVKLFGSNEDNSLTVDYRSGNPIPTGGLEFDGGGGHDTFVIGGSNVHLDLTDPAGPHFTNIEALNILGNSPNTLTLDVAAVLDVTDDENTLSVLSDGDDTVHLGSGWRIDGTAVEQGVFVRILHQGSAIVHLAGPWDWNNPLLAFDVNANGTVEPQDVLVVVNELNSPRFSLADRRLTAASGLATFPNFYYDAKADGFVVPLDALTIINFLNNRISAAEGEGSDLASNQVFEHFEFGIGPFIARATNGSEFRSYDQQDSAAMSRPEPGRICEQAGHTPEVRSSTEVLPQRWPRRSDRADHDLVTALNIIFADLGCCDEL